MHTPLAVAARPSFGAEIRGVSAEVLTTLAGIAAAVGVVAFNVGIERALDLDVLGLTFAFVIPAGAFFGGLGAASGYYVAARTTQTLPNRRILFEMLAIAFSTWVLMHWVEYATLRLSSGKFIRDLVPFWEFLQIRTEHLQLTAENPGGRAIGAPSELGMLGYAHELLQIAGFLLGALVMWLGLTSLEACAPCSRYAPATRLLQRAPSAVFDEILTRAGIVLPSLAQHVTNAVGKHRLVGLNLHIATCPSCRRSWIRPAAVVMQGSHPVVKRVPRYDVDANQAAELSRLVPAQ